MILHKSWVGSLCMKTALPTIQLSCLRKPITTCAHHDQFQNTELEVTPNHHDVCLKRNPFKIQISLINKYSCYYIK